MQEPKGILHLNSTCKLSEIRSDTTKKRKQQFVFRVSWAGEDEGDEGKEDNVQSPVATSAADAKTAIKRNAAKGAKDGKDKEGKEKSG